MAKLPKVMSTYSIFETYILNKNFCLLNVEPQFVCLPIKILSKMPIIIVKNKTEANESTVLRKERKRGK